MEDNRIGKAFDAGKDVSEEFSKYWGSEEMIREAVAGSETEPKKEE